MLASQKDIAGATRDATETSRCNHFALLSLLFAVRHYAYACILLGWWFVVCVARCPVARSWMARVIELQLG